MSAKDDENRINELIVELSECRADERDTQNQILQVISVAGAVMGVLLGASYFGGSKGEKMIDASVMFVFSVIIFCTAFSYVLMLGIKNILRYYYMQDLEDRLHILISNTSDNEKKACFLHWNTYIGPIITRNYHHITSGSTVLVFICYSAAVIGVAVFSGAMVLALYMQISPKTVLVKIVFGIFVSTALFIIFLFFRTSMQAKEASQFAWDMGRNNLEKRITGNERKQYEKSTSLKRMLLYLIYPKRKRLKKIILFRRHIERNTMKIFRNLLWKDIGWRKNIVKMVRFCPCAKKGACLILGM